MWRKYFFLVPRTRDGTVSEVGGAKVCRIAGMGYLPGTQKEDPETWSTEWFYIADVLLEDPIRMVFPPFLSYRRGSGTTSARGVIHKRRMPRWLDWPLK